MQTRPFWPRPVWLLASIAALSSLLSPTRARAEEPTIDQIEYHPAELPPDGARTRVILVGVALTAGWYGAALGTSYLWSDAPNASDLRLPVIGPWKALGNTGCGSKESGCTTITVIARTALAVVSGVGQAGGVFAIVEGLVMDTGSSSAAGKARVDTARVETARGPSWAAAPVVLSDGAGIELVGSF
jgi:hypothetical protein